MFKRILKDCLPTMFSLMMVGMYAVIDGLFIGNAVGDVGLAAINIAWPITATVTALAVGIGIGGSVLIAHNRGAGKSTLEVLHSTLGLLLSVSIGVLVVFLPIFPELLKLLGASGAVYTEAYDYSLVVISGSLLQIMGTGLIPILRNYDMSIEAMIAMVTGTIINIIANYTFIVKMDIGIKGAAYGTIIAQFIVFAMAVYLLAKRANVKLGLKINFDIAKQIAKVGITAFGVSLAPSISLLFANLQCLKYGGAEAVACYAVIAYVAFPAQALVSGVGDGTQPLMSYFAGSGERENLKQTKRIAKYLIFAVGTMLTIMTLLTSRYMGDWFGLSEAGKSYFELGMAVYAISFIVVGLAKFNLSYLNSTLQTKTATFLTYIESLLVSPVWLFLLPSLGLELFGVWLAYPATAIIMLVLNFAIAKKSAKVLIN